ncbi:capsule assembly Wzi family protein [Salinibacter ruber]|uniref:capsule assembly Wzi family protein n=1 Tax=Salinibacter ruber TaxID=146919 RepID=UPI00216A54E3|nr:capsule assembly Wzi family protein [Salinibacter ruber]MCS4038896.1 hypothetical protein [Salinibacter ruber]
MLPTDWTVVRWVGLLVLAWGVAIPQSGAQPSGDAVGYSATVFAAGGSGASLPFWLSANRYGVIDPASANVGLRLAVRRPFQHRGFTYAFGAEFVGRASEASTAHASELYGRLRYGAVQLTVGRRKQMIGRVAPSLSLGSVTWSKNAPPVPKITLSSDGYVPVPGTGAHMALKGHLAHGWFGRERFVRNALLHEKSLYLRAFSPEAPLQIHIGLVHHAQWGGTHPRRGEEPVSVRNWLSTVLGEQDVLDVRANANHLAAYDLSLDLDLGGLHGRVYREFYHEDIHSFRFRSAQDGLWGVRLRRPDASALVTAVLWEHLRMTRQYAKFVQAPARGDATYYHHGFYRDGWTYQGRTLGTPLITPAARTPGLQDNLPGIGNSIVLAHHVGIEGSLGSDVSYRLLGTYSRNYGAQGVCGGPACKSRVDQRRERTDQYSFRVEVRGPLLPRHNLRLRTAVAVDTGAFYDERIGASFGLTWRSP